LSEGYRVFHVFQSEGNSLAGIRKASINRTQTNTVANTAGQTQQPPVVRFEANDAANVCVYMLSVEGCRKLSALLPQLTAGYEQYQAQAQQMAATGQPMPQVSAVPQFSPGQLGGAPDNGPVEALTDEQYAYVSGLVDGGALDDGDVLEIDNAMEAQTAQDLWENRWALAQGERAT